RHLDLGRRSAGRDRRSPGASRPAVALSPKREIPGGVAQGALRMSRGLRLIPIVLLTWLVGGLAWRLIKPPSPEVPSQLVNFATPQFELSAAMPGKPGLKTAD